VFSIGCVGLVQFLIDSRLADLFLFATVLLLAFRWMSASRESRSSLILISVFTLAILFARPLLNFSNSHHETLTKLNHPNQFDNLITIDVPSMHCAGCVRAVIGALRELENENDSLLVNFSVDGDAKQAELLFAKKPSKSDIQTIVDRIASVGHDAVPKHDEL